MIYTDIALDHFRNPRNVGELPDADGMALIGDPSCGDTAQMWVRIREGRIAAASFKVKGCPAAIAACSMMTEMARGLSLAAALALRDEDVLQALGGLPDEKLHCSLFAAEVLHAAIQDCLARRAPEACASDHSQGARPKVHA